MTIFVGQYQQFIPDRGEQVEKIEDGVYTEPSLDPYARRTREPTRFVNPTYRTPAERDVEEARYALRSGPVHVIRPARKDPAA